MSDPQKPKRKQRKERTVKREIDRLELEQNLHAKEFYDTARELAAKRKEVSYRV